MKVLCILLAAIGFVACASPKKALIIAEGPKEQTQPQAPQPVAASASVPSTPVAANDGLRMPDMLQLPDDERLRSTTPEASAGAPVIARPPTD